MALAQTPTTATQKTMPVPNHLWSSVLLPDGLRLTATPRLPRPVYTPARFLSHVICQLGGAVAGLSILLLPSTAGVDSPRLQREPGAHTYQILRFCCRDPENDTTVLGLVNTAEQCMRSTVFQQDDAPPRDTAQKLVPDYERYHQQRSSHRIDTIVVRLNRKYSNSDSALWVIDHVGHVTEDVSLPSMS